MLTINLAIGIAVASLSAYLASRFSATRRHKVLVAAGCAALGILASAASDHLAQRRAVPRVVTRTAQLPDGRLRLEVLVQSGAVQTIGIDYPFLGYVHSIEPLWGSNALAKVEAWVDGGDGPPFVMNQLELRITEPQPRIWFVFYLVIRPSAQPGMHFVDEDRYRVTYAWTFKGESYSVDEFRSVKSHERVPPPPAIHVGWQVHDPGVAPAPNVKRRLL